MAELDRQLQQTKLKKVTSLDEISNPILRHLGPQAREGLFLGSLNHLWRKGEVPRQWCAASVTFIPNSGKDKKQLIWYRPIALTSNLSKLIECLTLAMLRHIVESRGQPPPEQTGLWAEIAVEDGRLIQKVLLPPPRLS